MKKNILNKFINYLNEWSDYLMEDKKRDFKSVIAAGQKIIAKIKNQSSEKILPYDEEDCFYTDYEPETAAGNSVEIETTDETFEEAEKSEQAFEYYEKIMSRLDSIKDKSDESVSEIIKKAENVFSNNSLKKSELVNELDNLMVEIDDKINVLNEKAAGAAETAEAIKEQAKSNYEGLSSSISDVSSKTDDVIKSLTEINELLKGSESKIDEIHEASIGIDKIVDTLFELKNSNVGVKSEIEELKKKQQFIKIWGIAASGVISAAVIALMILQIVR